MAYALLLIGGLVGGFFLPQRPRALVLAALLAGLYVAVVTAYAAARTHDVTTALSFFLLPGRIPDTEPGLGALVIGGGISVVSVIVAAVRLLLSHVRASEGVL